MPRPVSITPAPQLAEQKLALLVDRDEDTRRMYAEYLRLTAWRVEEASDGRDALAKAIAGSPDVVVTETHVPGISGYDLCTLLRQDAATAHVVIVVVTADGFAANVQRARDAGANAVLVKPCLPEQLLHEMRRLLSPSGGQDGSEPASAPRRRMAKLSELHRRGDTAVPPRPPPSLTCPGCDTLLHYQQSHVGGVSERQPEQWDYYECGNGCGTYQYRQRTRKLRKVS